MVAKLTVVSALDMGADPADPLLSHINECVQDNKGNWYQYQLLPSGRIGRVVISGPQNVATSLCPSRTEMQYKAPIRKSDLNEVS